MKGPSSYPNVLTCFTMSHKEAMRLRGYPKTLEFLHLS